jgi:hypothetical protein
MRQRPTKAFAKAGTFAISRKRHRHPVWREALPMMNPVP